MNRSPDYSIERLSEKAVIVQFESAFDSTNLNKILTLRASLEKNAFNGYIESVPGYSSLTVYFDPCIVSGWNASDCSAFDSVSEFINSIAIEDNEGIDSVLCEIPVCYDLKFALDLPELEKKLALSVKEIVALHSSQEYTVYMIGFTPGFPYLGYLPEQLECARKDNPRKKVPAGSLAMAGKQTGIYPFETPGGWQIIGRTPLKLFSVERASPSLLKPGDRVKFVPISMKEFQRLS